MTVCSKDRKEMGEVCMDTFQRESIEIKGDREKVGGGGGVSENVILSE